MQKRLFEYLADDRTADLNGSLGGLVEAGVYRGFDEMAIGSAFVQFNHAATGYKMFDGADLYPNSSLVITKRGCRITQTSGVKVLFSPTGVSVMTSHDLICDHIRVDTEGGNIATYYFQSPSDIITDDMVVIGTLYEFSDGTLIWKKRISALLGGRMLENEVFQQEALWRDKQFDGVVEISSRGMAQINEGGNIFRVNCTDGKTIYSLPSFKTIDGRNKKGATIKIIADGGILTISGLLPVGFSFNTMEKAIISHSDTIQVFNNGYVEFLECDGYWQLTNVFENYINIANIAMLLDKKETWGYLDSFRDAVNRSLSNSFNCSVNEDGFIPNASLHQRHYLTVNFSDGVDVLGFTDKFFYGMEVTVRFSGIGTSVIRNYNSGNPNRFKMQNRFDGVIKNNTVIRGIQTINEFLVTDFEALEEWRTPVFAEPNNTSLYTRNLMYRKRADGFVEFRGGVLFPPRQNGLPFIFTIPRDSMADLPEGEVYRIFVPPTGNTDFAQSFVNYHVGYDASSVPTVFNNTIEFSVPTSASSNIEINFSNILLSYK